MPAPPYKPARLVNADKTVSTRWYVVFWMWDAAKEKLVRKRDYSVNLKKTKSERNLYAKKLIEEINGMLKDGYHVSPKKAKLQKAELYAVQDKDYTVKQAFEYIMPIVKSSKRPDTYTSYNSVKGLFMEFCHSVGWESWKVRTLDKADIISFLDFAQAEKKISNTTRNKYMSFLAAMFSMMQERKVIDQNPAHKIKLEKEEIPGNTAYTLEQVEILKSALIAENPRLWLFVTFLLYGFIRPKEISRIKVGMIDLVKNEINLPGTITKNRIPRSVKISPHWKTYLQDLDLPGCQPGDYVFGKDLLTGPYLIQRNFASGLHTKVARANGFGPEYVLYCWKHTGVILHYKAGVDIKTLQRQIGHQSLQETDTYLRSLHLYDNTEIEDKSPKI